MAFRVNGVSTIITTDGLVGLGTTTPTSNIQLTVNSPNDVIKITQTGSGAAINVAAGNVLITNELTIFGKLNIAGNIVSFGANTIWHSGNDGSGSGLDADLLDGNNSGVFTNSTNQTAGTLPSGRLTGAYTGVTGVGTLTSLAVSGNTSFDTSTLFIDSVGNYVGFNTTSPEAPVHAKGTGIIVFMDGLDNNSSAAPVLSMRGRCSSGVPARWAFGPKLAMSRFTSDTATVSGTILGTIAFGGNHTDNAFSNIHYSASIRGVSDTAFTSNSDAGVSLSFSTDVVGRLIDDNGVNPLGIERLRIFSNGLSQFSNTLIVGENFSVVGRANVAGAMNVTGEMASTTGFKVGSNTVWHSGTLNVGSNTVWHSGNDGSGSGLDADLLDGNNSGVFTNSTNQTVGTLPSGRLTGAYTGVTGVGTLADLTVTGNADISLFHVDSVGNKVGINTSSPTVALDVVGQIKATANISTSIAMRVGSNTVWHQGNDGILSGLDADLLDGLDSTYFLDANNLSTGTVLSARLTGAYTGITGLGTLTSLAVSGNTAFDTNVLFVDSIGNKVSIGKVQPNSTLDVVGTINATSEIASATGFKVGSNTVWHTGNLDLGSNTAWHSGNDGAGSGLDADLLDGLDSTYFTNSTNQAAGTLPSARLTGAYTGITNVGTLTSLTVVSGNVNFDTDKFMYDTVGHRLVLGNGATQPYNERKLHIYDLSTTNGESGGILLEGINNTGSSPVITTRGRRTATSTVFNFGGKIAVERFTSDSYTPSGYVLGTIAFGGNHTDNTLSNIQYSSSIRAISEGDWTSNAVMNTSIIIGTSPIGRSINETSSNPIGSERLRIFSNGLSRFANTVQIGENISTPKINDGAVGGFKNIIHNPFGLVRQRSNKTAAGTGVIGLIDRWFSQRQMTGTMSFVALPQEQNGIPGMIRLWNSGATNQRIGLGQIALSNDTIQLRGRSVTLTANVRRGGIAATRMAILEWTGPADTADRNVVASWANNQFNPSGGFFTNTNINVLGETSVTPGAQTFGQMSLTGTVSTNCNNLIVFVWTATGETGTTGHLDLAAQLTNSDTAETYFEHRPYHVELEMCKKFYERIGGYSANTPFASGFADTTTAGLFPITFTEKRTNTVNISSSGSFTIRAAGADVPVSAIAISEASRDRALINATASGLTAGHGVMLKANNSASSYIEIDAEI